ncbi:MAG TPA: hypothetical protein VF581_11145 [Flavobacterium sp.]|jgi:hypothetical protein
MCDFTINYPGDKGEIISKLQGAIESGGGFFQGDTASGVFEGKTPVGAFSGNYKINGDDVNVHVEKKPFLVSCSRIEDEINKYLNRGVA